MGYALAQAAIEAGAHVLLISGPVGLPTPLHTKKIAVTTAQEMFSAVMANTLNCHLFLSVAAVGDYACQKIAPQKIPKTTSTLTLKFERNPDIISSVSALEKKPFIVGFAAETENIIANAKAKLINKKLDMIIANKVGHGVGMGHDDNAVTVLWKDQQREFENMSKQKLARELMAFLNFNLFQE